MSSYAMNNVQRAPRLQRGASLMMVMIILVIVSLVGVAAIQIASMAERGARNGRDEQVAWQSAEAALADAEFDIFGPVSSTRRALFGATPNLAKFRVGCGNAAESVGLCSLVATGKPAWLTVDFTSANAAAFGQFTSRAFAAGGAGVNPAARPRYVIEPIRDPGDRDLGSASPKYVYRVTAMGFGPREDIQAVLQMVYRI